MNNTGRLSMIQSQKTSIIDAFIVLFKLLPAEAQKQITEELIIEKASAVPLLKREFRPKHKLSSLEGKVLKMSAEEIDKQINHLRDEWQRDI